MATAESIELMEPRLSAGNDEEQSEISESVTKALAPLIGVERVLVAAEKPLPVLSVGFDDVPGFLNPSTWIGYGKTEPGKGLQLAEDVTYDGRGGRFHKIGEALPIDASTQRSVTFWPFAWKGGDEKTGQEGWWQQWRSDQFTVFAEGKAAHTHEYPDNDIHFGTKDFTAWLNPNTLVCDEPPIFYDVGAAEGTPVGATMDGGAIAKKPKRFMVLGERAVKSFFNGVLDRPMDKPELPQPLTDMLIRVADDLDLPR